MDTDLPDMKVLTTDGEIVDLSDLVEAVLVPAKLKTGSYNVTVSRRNQNIYEVEGKDYLIQTRYCHEYARRADAVLQYRGPYGYTKGQLVFRD